MEKKRIDVIATKESFHNLSSFKEVEELNKTVRAYRDNIRMSIKRTDVQSKLIALLEILKRHSCKYVGVSFLCKNRIAEKMEVSYKTVQRLMKKLVDLEMIKQVAMKRTKDMLQTSNAIIIQPIVEEVSNKVDTKRPTKCPTIKTTPVSLKQNIKDKNKRNSNENSNTPEENIKEADFVAHWVPQRFISLTSSFYSESKTIQELWKVVRQCNKTTNFSTGDISLAIYILTSYRIPSLTIFEAFFFFFIPFDCFLSRISSFQNVSKPTTRIILLESKTPISMI